MSDTPTVYMNHGSNAPCGRSQTQECVLCEFIHMKFQNGQRQSSDGKWVHGGVDTQKWAQVVIRE